MLMTPIVKRVRWGSVHIYEFEHDHGGEENGSVPQQRDVPPKKEVWGVVDDKDIWQASPNAGIWGPVDEV